MKISEAISKIDKLVPNNYTQADKISWLSEVDGKIYEEIIKTHKDKKDIVFNPYTEEDTEVELLAAFPYDDLYIKWLEASIHYSNNEYGKYNNAMEMFNAKMMEYSSYYNRVHMPNGATIKYF